MKKSISICIVTVMLFSTLFSVSSFAQNISYSNVFEPYTTYDLSKPAKESRTVRKSVNESINIDSTYVDGSTLTIKGDYGQKSFNLKGNLIANEDGEVLARLEDSNKNFEFLYFSIDKHPSKKLAFNKSTFANVNEFGLKLYLKDKATDKYVILETADPKFINARKIFSNINRYEKSMMLE